MLRTSGRFALLACAIQGSSSLTFARRVGHRLPSSAALRGGGSSDVRMMSTASSPLAEKISAHIESADVVVFSKTWCPFCQQTKGLFDAIGQPFTAIELDELADGAEMQMELAQMSGQRTVPNVFIKGKHLGGNDDTQRAARSGKLGELLGMSKL